MIDRLTDWTRWTRPAS